MHFSCSQIAEILGVCRSTLYRIEEEGVSRHLTYTNIADAELDLQIEAIKKLHRNDGERLMIEHLRFIGIFVPRSRYASLNS